MATVVNERDVTLQAASPRVRPVGLGSNFQVGQSSVTGLDAVVAGTKQIWIGASSQVIQISKAGVTTPANITLTANVRNLITAATISIVAGTMSVTPALTSGAFTFTPAQMTSDVVTFRLSLTESGTTYIDDMTVAKIREGADGVTGLLTNESMTLPADSSGTVTTYLGAGGAFKVYAGTTDITTSCTFSVVSNADALTASITASGSSAGQYSITAGYPIAKSLVALVLRATYGSTTIDKVVTIAKAAAGAAGANGTNGVNGSRTAVLEMYQWAASAPTTFPAGSSTYTWATGQFTNPATLNGWSLTPPAAVAGQTLWVVRQVYADAGTSSTSSVTWAATSASPAGGAGSNGANGANGQRVGVLEVYRWAVSAPTTYPSGTSTYTWANGTFTAPSTPSGWSLIPGAAVAGQTLWGIGVSVSDNLTTATSTATWNSSTVYAVGAAGANGTNGTNGVNGTRTAILDVYRWSASAPATFPSGTSTYTWATGQFTAPATLNGWSTTPPAPVSGQTLWIARQVYADTASTATSSVTWTTSTAMVASSAGSNGTNGQRVGVLEMYQWSATTPATFPSGTSTYTWATGAFTAPTTANGWSLLPGAAVAGQTLWGVSVVVSDNLTTATSTATWNSSTAYALGAAGTNGANGTNTVFPVLTNAYHVFQASPSGVVSVYSAGTTQIWVYEGTTALQYDGVGTANGTWTATPTATNITSGGLGDGGAVAYTLAPSNMTADTASIAFAISGRTSNGIAFSFTATQRFTKAYTGATGAAGASFWLARSANSVTRDPAGLYSPSAITFSAFTSTGSTPSAYSGKFTIETSTDGTTYSSVYASAANESSKTWSIVSGIKTFRVRLYVSTTNATLLDEEIVSIFASSQGGNLIDNSSLDTATLLQPPPWPYTNVAGSVVTTSGLNVYGVPDNAIRFLSQPLNILTRPGADTPTEMWAPGELTYSTGTTLSVDTTIYQTSPSSYKLTKPGLTSTSQGVCHLARSVAPGEVYRVHVWVRGDAASTNGLYIRINELNTLVGGFITSSNRTSFTALASNVAVTTSFVLLSYTYTVPANVYEASFAIFSHYSAGVAQGPVTLYFDDPTMNLQSGADSVVGQREQIGSLYIGATSIPINPAKTYRVVIPFTGYCNAPTSFSYAARRDRMSMTVPASTLCTLNTTTVLANTVEMFGMKLEEMEMRGGCALVFYIYPAGTTTGIVADSGVYDTFTGFRIGNATNYTWASGATGLQLKVDLLSALYNSALVISKSYLHVKDGSEPTLFSILKPATGYGSFRYWDFSNTLDGWVATGATTAVGATTLTLASTGTDPQLAIAGLSIDGSKYSKIQAKIKRNAGSGWDGSLFFTTAASPSFSSDKVLYTAIDPTVGQSDFVVVQWDGKVSRSYGGPNWGLSTITGLRLDLGATATDSFDIDWISVGAYGTSGVQSGSLTSGQLAVGSACQLYQISNGQYSATGGTTTVVDKITFTPGIDCEIVVTVTGDGVKSAGTSMSTGATSGAIAAFCTQNGTTTYSLYRGLTTSLPAAAFSLERRFVVLAGTSVDAGLYFGSATGINATLYSVEIKVEVIKR